MGTTGHVHLAVAADTVSDGILTQNEMIQTLPETARLDHSAGHFAQQTDSSKEQSPATQGQRRSCSSEDGLTVVPPHRQFASVE